MTSENWKTSNIKEGVKFFEHVVEESKKWLSANAGWAGADFETIFWRGISGEYYLRGMTGVKFLISLQEMRGVMQTTKCGLAEAWLRFSRLREDAYLISAQLKDGGDIEDSLVILALRASNHVG